MHSLLALGNGILLGTITGLIPGIHPNLIAAIVISTNPFPLAVTIAMLSGIAITHTFLNIIPAAYLSAPDPDNAMAMQPTHRYFFKGRAHEAVLINLLGSLSAAVISIALTPLIILFLQLYPILQKNIPYLLMGVIAILIFQEKERFLALTVFFLAGTLGVITLNINMKEPLLPLFSGLFGIPSILSGMKAEYEPVDQRTTQPKISGRKLIKCTWLSQITGIVFSMLPSLGPSQAAAIASCKSKNIVTYLMIVGALNTINIVVSVITFYEINKARNGIIHAVRTLSEGNPAFSLTMMMSLFLISLAPAVIFTIIISKQMAKWINKISYKKTMTCVFILLVITIILVSGITGVIIGIAATIVGTIPMNKNIRRSHLMGCLMVPTIIFYLTN